jgi:PKD repeat protein
VATPAGSIAATVTDSIVLGANTKLNNPGLPPLLPANAATLTFARTDQTTPAEQLFVNAAKRNLHLRPDAVDVDKGQLTAGDSATDVDGQPRVAGAAPDLGADEFVNSVPTAAFVVKTAPPRSTRPVTFDASTSTDREGGVGGGIVQYQWNFGDGTTESTTTSTVNHTYAKQGTFVASLIVVDRQGALSPAFAAPVTLTDGAPPVVVITKPKSGQAIALVTKAKKTVTKKGKKTKTTASKPTRVGFAGTAKDPSGITAVFLTLERISVASKRTATKKATSAAAKKPAKRCSWLDPKTGFVSRRCDKPVLIRTRVRGASWAYNIATRLKLVAGSYRVSVYGTDGAGAFGNSAPARKRVVRFTLK